MTTALNPGILQPGDIDSNWRWDKYIPSIGRTAVDFERRVDPELAWVGDISGQTGSTSETRFPWAACGRNLTSGGGKGLTKLLIAILATGYCALLLSVPMRANCWQKLHW